MASSTVNFAKGATSVDVNGPVGGQSIERSPRYAVARANDGTVWSYKRHSGSHRQWRLELQDVTSAQRDALQSFWDSDAAGPTNTFTYTHTDGVQYTARFVQEELQWRRGGPNQWSVSIILDLESAVS